MKYRILKWFIPILCYFEFLALFYLFGEIDIWLFGLRIDKMDGPTLPDGLMVFFALPLIPFGYILLVVAQLLYKKNRKWFNRFAWILTAATVLLGWVLEVFNMAITDSFLYHLWMSFPVSLFFYVPFFLVLLLCIQKRD